jgi:hypothetical protein
MVLMDREGTGMVILGVVTPISAKRRDKMTTREEMRSLAEEIVGSYADRVAGIAQLKQDESERKRTSAQEISQRKSDVDTMLREFDDNHTAMSRELKADLAKVALALREAESERKRTEAKEIAQRKSDAGTTLREFHEEQAGARDEWQKMTATMQSKRGGVAVAVKPLIEEITPETAALRGQIFEYLANHPDGAKITELEQEFGLARIQMARLLKDLRDENKVEKRELYYFAI